MFNHGLPKEGEALKHENKPEIIVDRGFCIEDLKRFGLKYRHVLVNAVESFFLRFKERTKKFWN